MDDLPVKNMWIFHSYLIVSLVGSSRQLEKKKGGTVRVPHAKHPAFVGASSFVPSGLEGSAEVFPAELVNCFVRQPR